MSKQNDTPTPSNGEPEAELPTGAGDLELGDELSRFARRLAGFGLGEALDAVLLGRNLKKSGAPSGPNPC